MSKYVSDIAFTPAVKKVQEEKGPHAGYADMEEDVGWQSKVTDDLVRFISEQDSFYLGTANSDGQPYIQHRGGKPSFFEILDDTTLAFADFRGNQQYISSGNLNENSRAYIFLMDYANRRRTKIWGNAHVVDENETINLLRDSDYRSLPEQTIVFDIKACDVNCSQHMTPRFTEIEITDILAPLQNRIEELEAQLQKVHGERS